MGVYSQIKNKFKNFENHEKNSLQLLYFQRVKSSNSIKICQQYLNNFPNNENSHFVEKKLLNLTREEKQRNLLKEQKEKKLEELKRKEEEKLITQREKEEREAKERQIKKEQLRKDLQPLIEWADKNNISEFEIPRDVEKLSKIKKLNLGGRNLNPPPFRV